MTTTIDNNQMQKVATGHGYDYYIVSDGAYRYYNLVPMGNPAPSGGYSKNWILGVKKVPDLFQPSFLNEWEMPHFTSIKKAICKHFRKDEIRTAHGNYPKDYRSFDALGEIIGLAYTSSSSYAGYWVTNTEVYNKNYPGFRYIGFAISADNKYYAILWDKYEKELIIEL